MFAELPARSARTALRLHHSGSLYSQAISQKTMRSYIRYITRIHTRERCQSVRLTGNLSDDSLDITGNGGLLAHSHGQQRRIACALTLRERLRDLDVDADDNEVDEQPVRANIAEHSSSETRVNRTVYPRFQ